jgi:tripeptide aminopeptidase
VITEERIIREFIELVQVDSETKHEQEIAQVLKRKFTDLGLQVEEDESAALTGHGAGNLICTLPATPGKVNAPKLLFTCHMDTVTPGNGIKPRLDDQGYITSDGTTILGADDKAGIAAVIEGIRVLKEQGLEHGQLQVILTVGEESGLNGSRHMDSKWLDAEYGFAMDSNGAIGGIAVAAPSQQRMLITFSGKTAHAGVNPQDGVSAITMASRAIARMPLGRIDEETTANIGRFAGGGESKTNIVCDRVEVEAEARSLSKEKLEQQVATMVEACETVAAEMGGSVAINSFLLYPSFNFEAEAPIVQLASRALRSIGAEPFTFRSGGGSDANVFNGHGVPTINLSVGYEHIHTTEERIKAEDIIKLGKLFVAITQEG